MFDTSIKDGIFRITDVNGNRLHFNGLTDDINGYEIEIAVQAMEDMLIRGTYTNFITKDNGVHFRESDKTASLIINYSPNKWNFNINTYWHDTQQFTVGTTTQKTDDFYVINTRLAYSVGKQNFFVQLDNLSNNDYLVAPQNESFAIPNRGRLVFIGYVYEL